jgi:hypothetical protein
MIEVLKSELPRIEICGGFIQNYGEEVKRWRTKELLLHI